MADNRYCVDYAKTGRSSCKKCKTKIDKGCFRIGKLTPNPFGDAGDDMKVWYHPRCMFETLVRARATTKKIETADDLEDFTTLEDPEKEEIRKLLKEFASKPGKSSAKGATAKSPKKKPGQTTLPSHTSPSKPSTSAAPQSDSTTSMETTPHKTSAVDDVSGRDNSFKQFRRLCEDIEKEPSYNAKTKLVSTYLKYGNNGDGFTGDVYLLVKLLLPGAGVKRVYNLQSKQIVKILAQIFKVDVDEMIEDLEKGDVAETAKTFFEASEGIVPAKTSTLTLADVDNFLDKMTNLTKEDEQKNEMAKITRKCTVNDLKYIIRLIKHDLRINSGPKHILDALNPTAYAAFQVSQDLKDVVDRSISNSGGGAKPGMSKSLSIRLSLKTPVKPMLAEACRSVAMAMKKCPSGMFAEIKYDGERVQVHKKGSDFQYFSRSLKPVQAHKVSHIKDYLPQACPHGDSMILDSEVLMMDIKTGSPLPFGTLGIHKKSAFKDAACCLFIFDILYFNGESLLDKPLSERRKLLEKNVTEIPNHIMLSEMKLVNKPDELSGIIMKVIKQGLEGLVLKDTKSIYEPGKRHWLKVKKDYLEGGAMADTADLIVLGAYFGTGNKGGMMSVFLMGVHDKTTNKFCTVCKCGNGHDDATIRKLQKQLDMVKINKDYSKVPSWLNVNRGHVPDFVVTDPKKAPVWEITGAEFSQSTSHTAGGVSIRFPRVTRIRDDKDWSTATDLDRLKTLYKTSKENVDLPGFSGVMDDDDEEMEVDPPSKPTPTKRGTKRRRNSDSSASTPKKRPVTGNESEEIEVDTPSKPTPTKRGTKRRRNSDSSASPPKKRPVTGNESNSKPECKYGVKYYQKGKEHREKFSHPREDKLKAKCGDGVIDNPLIDLFTGYKIFMDESVTKAKEIERYIISYDGEVLKSHEIAMATHIITEDKLPLTSHQDNDISDAIVFLKPDWVWDSLEQKTVLPIKDYKL